jgi:hypothetical protein
MRSPVPDVNKTQIVFYVSIKLRKPFDIAFFIYGGISYQMFTVFMLLVNVASISFVLETTRLCETLNLVVVTLLLAHQFSNRKNFDILSYDIGNEILC